MQPLFHPSSPCPLLPAHSEPSPPAIIVASPPSPAPQPEPSPPLPPIDVPPLSPELLDTPATASPAPEPPEVRVSASIGSQSIGLQAAACAGLCCAQPPASHPTPPRQSPRPTQPPRLPLTALAASPLPHCRRCRWCPPGSGWWTTTSSSWPASWAASWSCRCWPGWHAAPGSRASTARWGGRRAAALLPRLLRASHCCWVATSWHAFIYASSPISPHPPAGARLRQALAGGRHAQLCRRHQPRPGLQQPRLPAAAPRGRGRAAQQQRSEQGLAPVMSGGQLAAAQPCSLLCTALLFDSSLRTTICHAPCLHRTAHTPFLPAPSSTKPVTLSFRNATSTEKLHAAAARIGEPARAAALALQKAPTCRRRQQKQQPRWLQRETARAAAPLPAVLLLCLRLALAALRPHLHLLQLLLLGGKQAGGRPGAAAVGRGAAARVPHVGTRRAGHSQNMRQRCRQLRQRPLPLLRRGARTCLA